MIRVTDDVAIRSIDALQVLARQYRAGGDDYLLEWQKTVDAIRHLKTQLEQRGNRE